MSGTYTQLFAVYTSTGSSICPSITHTHINQSVQLHVLRNILYKVYIFTSHVPITSLIPVNLTVHEPRPPEKVVTMTSPLPTALPE